MTMRWRERRLARSVTRAQGSGFAESSLAQAAWERTRKTVARWAWAGLLNHPAPSRQTTTIVAVRIADRVELCFFIDLVLLC